MDNIKKKILLAEDDSMISSMYKMKFEEDGYNVILAENGSDALKMIKTEKPDLVLLDVIMTQMDGFEVLKAMKNDMEMKDIPVVMLTNLSTDEDKAKGKELGAAEYLVKASFTPSQVEELVLKFLTK